MKYLIGFLFGVMVASAAADEKNVMCTGGENQLWFEAGSICHANPLERVKPAQKLVPLSSVTIATPSCPKDRTLVMIDDRTTKCAKDLTDPE